MRPRTNIPRRSACQPDVPPGAFAQNDAGERLTVPEFFRQHVSGACEWILEQEGLILKKGTPLTTSELGDARLAGVAEPGRIRLLRVGTIPIPAHPLMRAAAQAMGLNTSLTPCLAARYGIYILSNVWGQRWWVAHELAHTAQYERLGIRPFIECYLYQCLAVGYPSAPMEQEAIGVADRICRSSTLAEVPNETRPPLAMAKRSGED